MTCLTASSVPRPGPRLFSPLWILQNRRENPCSWHELPGVKREDIKIALQNGVLTLSAERKETALPAEARWIRNEIPEGRFSRSVTMPHDVDADRVTAELKDGILRVVLPKAASAHPKEIKVQ